MRDTRREDAVIRTGALEMRSWRASQPITDRRASGRNDESRTVDSATTL